MAKIEITQIKDSYRLTVMDHRGNYVEIELTDDQIDLLYNNLSPLYLRIS